MPKREGKAETSTAWGDALRRVDFSRRWTLPKSRVSRSRCSRRMCEIGVVERVPIAGTPSRAKMMVVAGDLLMSLTRPTRRAIAFATEEEIASTGFAVIHGFSHEVMPEYLSVILRSELCTYQFDQRSTGGNYPAITEEQLLRREIPIAAKEVQARISSAASSIRTEARKLKADATAALDAVKRKIEVRIAG